jgi:hypothetical protein
LASIERSWYATGAGAVLASALAIKEVAMLRMPRWLALAIGMAACGIALAKDAKPIAAPTADETVRINAALKELRKYEIGILDFRWTSAIARLIKIGQPAVPAVIEELDHTTRPDTIRALAFVLRGIGDKRAIPALIRALPRTLVSGASDWGWRRRNEPEIAHMLEPHTMDKVLGGDDFGGAWLRFGRPFVEVSAALRKLTGHERWELELEFVVREGSLEQLRLKRQLFARLTREWAEWWAGNWRRYVGDETDAQIEATLAAGNLELPPGRPAIRELPLGQAVKLVRPIFAHGVPAPLEESPADSCLDLDTGRRPVPPLELAVTIDGRPSSALLAWADRNGVDVIGVRHQPPGADIAYRCLMPLGMRVRPVTQGPVIEVQQQFMQGRPVIRTTSHSNEHAVLVSLRAGEIFEFPQRAPELLVPMPDQTVILAFSTREGCCGFLKFNDRSITESHAAIPDRYITSRADDPGDVGLSYQFLVASEN